jgi:hypothetical protein
MLGSATGRRAAWNSTSLVCQPARPAPVQWNILRSFSVCRYEGIYGTAILAVVVLPLMQLLPGPEGQGLHEDSLETLHMLVHSPQLQAAFGAYIAVISVYNIAGE